MINLQHFIKGNNINRGFVDWSKKLGIQYGYTKAQNAHRPYKAKAIKLSELEKFIQRGRERVREKPSLNSDTEAGLLTILRILERALKQVKEAQ